MFYTTIIGYRALNPELFRPKRARYGKDHKPIMGRYDRPYEDDCSKQDITKFPITAWRSNKDSLECLNSEEKRVTNAIKGFISETNSAIWYHNGACDGLSEFG